MENVFESWIVNRFIAHRGLHDETAPENSILSFQKAIEGEFPIEIDVQSIEDGTPIVFHDKTLNRLTGKDGYVKHIKNIDELKSYTLLNSSQKIPTLKETLEFIKGRVPILIEIKDNNISTNFEKRVYEVIKDYEGDIAVMSFNPFSLRWFYQNAPHIIRGQLSSSLKNEKIGPIKRILLRKIALSKKTANPQFIAYKWDEVPNRYLKKVKDLPLIVWPVQSQGDYMKVVKYCDNIIFENFIPRI